MSAAASSESTARATISGASAPADSCGSAAGAACACAAGTGGGSGTMSSALYGRCSGASSGRTSGPLRLQRSAASYASRSAWTPTAAGGSWRRSDVAVALDLVDELFELLADRLDRARILLVEDALVFEDLAPE